VRREGRVTIPKELRDALVIKEGNLVNEKSSKLEPTKQSTIQLDFNRD
jgi:bifunctional DNA-binding transcriptional regulator/antitoxin component of YhaV-PrlF toxin-antitoxin module